MDNPYTPPVADLAPPSLFSPQQDEEIRRHHLKHEASLKTAAALYFLGATIVIIMGIFMLSGEDVLKIESNVLIVGGIVLLVGCIQFWAGIGLLKRRRAARIPVGILSGLGVLKFPIGTLVNGWILYLVFSEKGKRVFSDDYQRIVAATPHIRRPKVTTLTWVLLGIMLILAVMVGMAYFS